VCKILKELGGIVCFLPFGWRRAHVVELGRTSLHLHHPCERQTPLVPILNSSSTVRCLYVHKFSKEAYVKEKRKTKLRVIEHAQVYCEIFSNQTSV
jgi:hypothetical protein